MADSILKPDILQTAKGTVPGDIEQLQTAVYGREVRASIAEAVYLLYTGNILVTLDGSEKPLVDMLRTIDLRLKHLEMAVGIYDYPYPDLDGDGVVSSVDAVRVQSFAAAAGNGAYTNDRAGWTAFAEENGLSGIYPDVNGDGFADAVDAALMMDFAAAAGNGAYTNDKAGWNAYMNSLFSRITVSAQNTGTLTPHLTGITGTAGIMENTETEA